MTEQIREVEKNDVDISELFRWNKEVEIEDTVSGISAKFYMRLLGDADIGKVKAFAYRKSAELRKKLKTSESDERISLLIEIQDFSGDMDIIINSILLLRLQDMYQDAVKSTDLPEPREPSKEDLEVWEEYQKAIDSYPQRFRDAVEKEYNKIREGDLKELKVKPIESLYNIYEGEVINRLCQEEMNNAFYDMTIYLSTFKDKSFKIPAFKSYDVYENTHKNLKSRLKEEYRKIELGLETLKKLQEATD